jgi:hypothetical protein
MRLLLPFVFHHLKHKKMESFIEKNDEKFELQLSNYALKLPTYATILGIDATTIAAFAADSACFSYIMTGFKAVETFSSNVSNFKKTLRHGGQNQLLSGYPELPDLGTPPTLVAADIQLRFSNHAQILKKHPNYTTAIGQDLGIVAAASSFDPSTGKPAFKIELSNGGHPHLKWIKSGFQGVEIWKDAGNGFAFLDKDFRPDFTDKKDLPAVGETAIWKYKMIYLYNDERVGDWSDEVSVTVTGTL